MEFFTWKDRFSVNHAEMDRQHQTFFRLLNKLYDQSRERDRSDASLENLFDELVSYIMIHFEEEEQLMASRGLDGLAEQQRQHQYFRDQIALLREQHATGSATVFQGTLNFMRDWFLNHILDLDHAYGQALVRQAQTAEV